MKNRRRQDGIGPPDKLCRRFLTVGTQPHLSNIGIVVAILRTLQTFVCKPALHGVRGVVGEAGLEPTTPGLEGRCSIQLSYSPVSAIVSPPGARSRLGQGNIHDHRQGEMERVGPAFLGRCAVAPQPSTNHVTPKPGTASTCARRKTRSTRTALAGIARSLSVTVRSHRSCVSKRPEAFGHRA